jgi:N-acetylmuramoyl-L-alanine amidase
MSDMPDMPEGLDQIDLRPGKDITEQPTPVPEETPQPQQPDVEKLRVERLKAILAKTEPAAKLDPVKVASKPAGPIFKVQIFVSPVKLKANDARFKKHKDAVFFQENGMYKYTIGASEDYNAINRLLKELLADFPEAFIIAFKNGSKMNVVEAVKEFKSNKLKR